MQIGYIHIGKEQQSRVMQMLKRLTEPGALDEIGIGRIRDAFADRLFPGTSTLQKHAKYFSLMPQLYQRAASRKYNRLSEVQTEIIRLEKKMTENLWRDSDHASGITGSEMIERPGDSYVKYDPAYIYNSGLRTFEIVRCKSVHQAIYNLSKKLHAQPKAFRSDDENVANDAEELTGAIQPWDVPLNIEYDFLKECPLTLTAADKTFIRKKMLSAPASQDTLLSYLLEHPEVRRLGEFPWIMSEDLPSDLRQLYDNAIAFSEFVYLLRLRYYWLYSSKQDKEVLEAFNTQFDYVRSHNYDMEAIIDSSGSYHQSTRNFCLSSYQAAMNDNMEELDSLIIRRERQLKGSRSKIGTDGYSGNGSARLNYRWETVGVYLNELKEEVNHG